MCRSNNDPDGPRSCSGHARQALSKTSDEIAAVDSSPAATALAEAGTTPSAPADSHLAEADGTYTNIDRKERVAAMLEDLKGEVASLGTQQAWTDYLTTTAKFHNYSLNNRILIALQTQGRAQHVAGFRKWDKEFGRKVIKGSKAIHILAPRVIKDKDDLDEQGKPKEKVVGFTSASVFADYQTSGDPLPKPPTVSFDRATGEAPDGMHEDLDTAIKNHGFTVRNEDLGEHGADGYTNFTEKEVVINSRYASAHQAATKSHEWAHIELGHGESSRDYHNGPGGQRPTMEVEAESASWVINQHYGLETKESFSYIDGWAKGNPDRVGETADRVGKACNRMLKSIGK